MHSAILEKSSTQPLKYELFVVIGDESLTAVTSDDNIANLIKNFIHGYKGHISSITIKIKEV